MITHTEDAGPNVSYVGYDDGVTYTWGTGNNVIYDGFIYNGTTYLADQAVPPDLVAIRRMDNPDSSGVRCRVFAEATNNSTLVTTFPGSPPPNGTTAGICSMESVLGGRILNMGTLDLFANDDNDGGGGTAKNNIERVDYITTAGITIPNIPGFTQTQGILVNEKSHNNAFQIAVIKSLDGSGNPSDFGPLFCVRPGSSGNSGTSDVGNCAPGVQNWVIYGPNISYIENGTNIGTRQYAFRFLNDEFNAPQTGRVKRVGNSNEHLGAAFVSLEDMGVTQGDTIFGYAWFPVDVDNCSGPDNTCLADWTDTSIYPANTGDTGNGWESGADIFGGLVGIFIPSLDYGDAPDGGMVVSGVARNYATTSANNGPAHEIGGPYLGANPPDSEPDGQPSIHATDDGGDEDGLVLAPLYDGQGTYFLSVSVNNPENVPAQLVSWLDWGDGITPDGNFDNSDPDRSHPDLAQLGGNAACVNQVDGTFTTGNIPAGCVGTAVLKWTNAPILTNPNSSLTTFLRLRITTDGQDTQTGFFSDSSPEPTGVVANGEIEDFEITFVTTPITLGYFKANQGMYPGEVEFTWQTVTEVGNLGFNLYVREGKKGERSWRKINAELIPSRQGDSVKTQTYLYSATDISGKRFALGDVDVYGKETLHGPFMIGEVKGVDRSQRETTDWEGVKAERMTKSKARKVKHQQRLERKLQRKLGITERQLRRQLR